MRNIFIFAIIIILTACSSGPADGDYSFELYAHGDIHGRFFSNTYVDGGVNEGSLSGIYSFISQRREAAGADKVIFLDLGDHNHGDNSTHFYNYVYDYLPDEKHLYTRVAEFVGYDAIVAGNHDLEVGLPVFTRIRDELGIPYLAANVVSAKDGVPFFEPYTIIEREGIKIAIIGLTTPEVKKWLGEEKIEGLDVVPIYNAAVKYVAQIREKEKPHLVFLAVHAGTGDGTPEDVEDPCRYMAASIEGIDGVFASHDHIPYCGKEWNGKDSIVVVNSGPYGKKLSGVKVSIAISDGVVSSRRIDAVLHNVAGEGDSLFNSTFGEDYLRVKEFSNRKLGSIDEDIVPGDIFDAPCLYSNLLHYVQLQNSGADISFVSPTKFRGSVPAGDICYNDILDLYPFENLLYKVSLTGAQIKNYLELSYDNWKKKPVSFDCAGGLRYTVDFSKPLGSRVNVISFTDGRPFNEDATYTAAMASYRANGGGNLLLEATGLHLEQLEGIFIEKYGPVKEMLYDFFRGEKKTAASLAAVSDWKIL
ncbi:MAG: bifunctional metallophosphatase/5'-nucleotidase [Bacteroidales bacterium]|nr:bifunctional metallophosphatase/5'-nucleotidase [Bacteroidales bacterium]